MHYQYSFVILIRGLGDTYKPHYVEIVLTNIYNLMMVK